jgi:hypothetical protein
MNNPRRKPARRAASTAGNEVWGKGVASQYGQVFLAF